MARTRSEDYDEKRQQILDRAAALFARHGFARASISMLSKECNASKAWIYHYYDSKEAILFDLLDQHIKRLIEVTSEAVTAHAEPKARLRALLHTLMDIYVVARDKHIVLLNDLNSLPPEQQTYIVGLENEMVHGLADLVEQLNPDYVRQDRRRRTPLAMALLGMINWTYTWFRPEGPISPAEFADMAADLFLGGVLGLHGRPGSPAERRRRERAAQPG